MPVNSTDGGKPPEPTGSTHVSGNECWQAQAAWSDLPAGSGAGRHRGRRHRARERPAAHSVAAWRRAARRLQPGRVVRAAGPGRLPGSGPTGTRQGGRRVPHSWTHSTPEGAVTGSHSWTAVLMHRVTDRHTGHTPWMTDTYLQCPLGQLFPLLRLSLSEVHVEGRR